jgi:XTP/dITP diphosphohydrolase
MKTVYFITSNKGKFLEAKKKFSESEIKIIKKDLGYPEIQAESLEDVANFGIEYIQKRFDKSFFLEDAGLFIDGLNGFPGVYSAYIFHKIGCSGIIKLMEGLEENNRKAHFKSVIAFKEPNSKPKLFIGEVYGSISKKPLGKYGFGYDPIFIPDNEIKTFAQMETEEKNQISHRGKSLNKLLDFFKNGKIETFKSL